MRTQIRIVAGALRGRKLSCTVSPSLRPTPDMVREALFSILGNAVPDRPFFDVFAGSGVVGLEAISRGAASTTFVERDFRLVEEIERHLESFQVADRGRIERADVYRWAERWQPSTEPVNLFLSPPFADFERRNNDFMELVGRLQEKVAAGSVVVVQGEQGADLDLLPDRPAWDERKYGRNLLLIWVKAEPPDEQVGPEPSGNSGETP
jgi:16S rRNA (guanine(966)-N(2))-methyltransferase RsmD